MNKKVAFVVQRCGREVNGGAEKLCFLIAQRISINHQVEVLTTCAVDYISWANHYPPGIELIDGVFVRRFLVSNTRVIESFNSLSSQLRSNINADLDQQQQWMRSQGPWSPELFEFIKSHSEEYHAFVFFGYLYAQTWFGLPLVANKAILVPLAHDEWTIYLSMWDHFFSLPCGFIFNTIEERDFITKRFPTLRIDGPVAGVAIDHLTDIDPLRFRLKYKIDGGFLLYIGRIDPSKGCDSLFAFFLKRRVARKNPAKLLLFGNATMLIPDHADIISLGFINEQDKWDGLAACDALVMPSPYESLSMVLLEAWSVAKPVIVNGHCKVLVGQCQRSNGGIWYESFSQFDQCLDIIQNGFYSSVIGKQGWRFVRKNYSWDSIESVYLDCLRDLIPKGSS